MFREPRFRAGQRRSELGCHRGRQLATGSGRSCTKFMGHSRSGHIFSCSFSASLRCRSSSFSFAISLRSTEFSCSRLSCSCSRERERGQAEAGVEEPGHGWTQLLGSRQTQEGQEFKASLSYTRLFSSVFPGERNCPKSTAFLSKWTLLKYNVHKVCLY